jgi:hypothetical protein
MSSNSISAKSIYTCNIIYHPLQIPAPAGNTATYTFSPPLPPEGLNPGDHLHFKFSPAPEVKTPGKLDQAVLIAGYKEGNVTTDSSPFHNDANNIDLHSFPTLTIGKRPGVWGFTVAFSLIVPAIGSSKTTTHFYFLPDPQIIIKPN